MNVFTWDKGKEGTQNSPPSYWEPSGSNNRAEQAHTETLDYAELANVE